MWKEDARLEPQLGMERYHSYYAVMRGVFIIVDNWRAYGVDPGFGLGMIPPDDAVLSLPPDALDVLLDAVAETELIDRVLAGKTYTKEAMNRHLDIIEKLIEKMPTMKGE